MEYGTASVATIDWREFYEKYVKNTTFGFAEIEGADTLKRECFQTKKLTDRVCEARNALKSTPEPVLVEMMDLAANMPAVSPMHNVSLLEDVLASMYSDYGIGDYFQKICTTRATMRGARSDSSRWTWVTVYAHLLVISSVGPDKLKNENLIRDSFFVAARFAGPKFMDFIYMMLTVKCLLGIDPPAFNTIALTFIDILNRDFEGAVPVSHFYYEQTTY